MRSDVVRYGPLRIYCIENKSKETQNNTKQTMQESINC